MGKVDALKGISVLNADPSLPLEVSATRLRASTLPFGVLSLPFRAPKVPFIQSPVCLAGQSEEARTGAYEPGACTASARQTYHRRVSGSFLSGLDHMSLTSRIRVTIGVSDPVPDAFTAASEVHTTSLSTLSNVLAAQMLQFSSRLQSQ